MILVVCVASEIAEWLRNSPKTRVPLRSPAAIALIRWQHFPCTLVFMDNATERMTDGAEPVTAAFDHNGERRPGEHLSRLLERLAQAPHERTTVGDIVIALQDRSFGAFLLIFALPNLVPAPPGATLFLGLLLIFVTWQMLASAQGRIYLPRRIGNYGVTTATFQLVVNRLAPSLRRAETLIKPRFWFLATRLLERLLGFVALVLAVLIFLPIPLGNWLPALALALAIIGFAHSQCDGFGVLIGVAVGAISLLVASFVVYTAGAVLFLVI